MAITNIKYFTPQVGSTTDNPQVIEGAVTVDGQPALLIADMDSRQLLEAILIELRILNLRQQEVFEETVKEEDILCE